MTRHNDQVKALVVAELPRLRRFAYSLTGSKADADDLVQNVVIRVLNAQVPDHGNTVPWLLRICKNCWIDEMRGRTAQKRALDTLQDETPAAGSDGEKHLINQLDIDRVIAAIAHLNQHQRMALSLVAIENLSYDEASQVLDVPIGTIMSRVARARAKLQTLLH
jgi:RNA polymerase sigma-70 factor (ECF subfamily)